MICRPDRFQIARPCRPFLDKIGRTPSEGGIAQLYVEHIRDKTGMSPITVWEGVNVHKPMMESNCCLIW